MTKLSHRKGTVCFIKLLCLVFEYSLSIEDQLTLLLFSIYCSFSPPQLFMWVIYFWCFGLLWLNVSPQREEVLVFNHLDLTLILYFKWAICFFVINMSLLAYQLLALVPINEFPIGLILFLGDRFQICYIERLVFVFLFVLEKI